MKSVLISIQPKWCEKIARGEKTIEVRKTRPKLRTPFKCYIYCTANGITAAERDRNIFTDLRCKVIGEFVCDHIFELAPINRAPDNLEDLSCLTREQIVAYLKGKGYGWHVSNLVIYDKPKELGEFFQYDRAYEHSMAWAFGEEEQRKPVTRPHQSWCYVEEDNNATD